MNKQTKKLKKTKKTEATKKMQICPNHAEHVVLVNSNQCDK